MTLSKSKLLEWIQVRQVIADTQLTYAAFLSAKIIRGHKTCWNLLVEAIEEGDFDV